MGPDRSGIDVTAGIPTESIFVGILIAGIGDKDGSVTALKQIVRADAPDRMGEPKWSAADKAILAKINGTSVETVPLKLVASDMAASSLWIGARKGLPANLDEPFKGSLLRLTTSEWSAVPMKRLV